MPDVPHIMARLVRALKIFGPGTLSYILAYRLVGRRLSPLLERSARRRLKAFAAKGGSAVIVIRATLDLAYPYAQRVQHLAWALTRAGASVIYVTPAHGHDRVLAAREIAPGLILTPHLNAALAAAAEKPVLMLLSTDGSIPEALPSQVAARGGLIVYDYIDHLDDAVSSHKLSDAQRALHRRLLTDERNVVVVATADALFTEARRYRARKLHLITNGVETAFFRRAVRSGETLRSDFARIVARGRPMAGYFGSFASWFDYDLIRRVAEHRPDVDFVLIGPDLDGSSHGLANPPANLFLLSAMRYTDLPRHAVWFDIALLPFRVNELTLATSPLKIFEYMALGLPTAATDLPECRKYRSVVTAKVGHTGFIAALDQAFRLARQPEFADLARREGETNDWSRKAEQLMQAL